MRHNNKFIKSKMNNYDIAGYCKRVIIYKAGNLSPYKNKYVFQQINQNIINF